MPLFYGQIVLVLLMMTNCVPEAHEAKYKDLVVYLAWRKPGYLPASRRSPLSARYSLVNTVAKGSRKKVFFSYPAPKPLLHIISCTIYL